MMISQLATVAIKARFRVSPATVLPKFVIRSKSRSRSFCERPPRASRARSGRPRARGRCGGSARSGDFAAGAASAAAAGATISNRRVGLVIPACVEDLAEDRPRPTCAGDCVLWKAVVLNVQLVLPGRRRTGRPRPALPASRRPAGSRRRGSALPGSAVITTRCRAGPNALRIASLTLSVFCSVVRMLNRVRRLSPPTFRLSTVDVGQDARLLAARSSARCDSRQLRDLGVVLVEPDRHQGAAGEVDVVHRLARGA